MIFKKTNKTNKRGPQNRQSQGPKEAEIKLTEEEKAELEALRERKKLEKE